MFTADSTSERFALQDTSKDLGSSNRSLLWSILWLRGIRLSEPLLDSSQHTHRDPQCPTGKRTDRQYLCAREDFVPADPSAEIRHNSRTTDANPGWHSGVSQFSRSDSVGQPPGALQGNRRRCAAGRGLCVPGYEGLVRVSRTGRGTEHEDPGNRSAGRYDLVLTGQDTTHRTD